MRNNADKIQIEVSLDTYLVRRHKINASIASVLLAVSIPSAQHAWLFAFKPHDIKYTSVFLWLEEKICNILSGYSIGAAANIILCFKWVYDRSCFELTETVFE